MADQPWYKSELAIAGSVIAALFALALWFAKEEMISNKEQNKAQWSEAAKTKDAFKDRLSLLEQRIAAIEGFHKAEEFYNCKEKAK